MTVRDYLIELGITFNRNDLMHIAEMCKEYALKNDCLKPKIPVVENNEPMMVRDYDISTIHDMSGSIIDYFSKKYYA